MSFLLLYYVYLQSWLVRNHAFRWVLRVLNMKDSLSVPKGYSPFTDRSKVVSLRGISTSTSLCSESLEVFVFLKKMWEDDSCQTPSWLSCDLRVAGQASDQVMRRYSMWEEIEYTNNLAAVSVELFLIWWKFLKIEFPTSVPFPYWLFNSFYISRSE